MENVNVKRIHILFGIIILLFGLLGYRLYDIQINGIEEYQHTSVSQATVGLGGIGFRGTIYDRNGQALTNAEKSYIFLIEKTKIDENCKRLLADISAAHITIDNRRYSAYQGGIYDEEIVLTLKDQYDAFMFVSNNRYAEGQSAVHLIGYLNRMDNSGAFGLERSFDDLLKSDESLTLMVDASRKILPGYGVQRVGEPAKGTLTLTLDFNIQKKVEEAFEKSGLKGSVVVLDATTGDFLAGASYPTYDPSNVAEVIESGNDELINRIYQTSYPPGSVFKIIVAACALEEKIADLHTEFHCEGFSDVNGIIIKCSKEEGHGDITLEEAFAQSCNCAFIELGQELGSYKILAMAKKFGVGEKVLNILQEESEGILPNLSETAGAGIGNLSIGQGKLEMTCLQVAKMTQIVAAAGKSTGIRLITDPQLEEEELQKDPVISLITALKLKRMMSLVVEEGTARRITISAAGKTGSAQSSDGGKKVVHGWFTGFFPENNPKYVVTVLVESGRGASQSVTIFNEIAESLK